MSDDFGTISARRGDRAKEIEVLRKHRESLVKMLADVDQELKELEIFDNPGARPLVTTTPDYDEPMGSEPSPGAGPRVVLILGAALLALVLIAWMIWRASSDRPAKTSTVVEETTAATTTTEEPTTAAETTTAPATIAEVPTPTTANALSVAPASRDYGLVRKGTRVTRQFEVANNSEEPMSINVARSACRCLYYEHAPVIPPKAKESITVTVDGAKASAGTLRESIKVSAKSDPSVSASFDVIATVR